MKQAGRQSIDVRALLAKPSPAEGAVAGYSSPTELIDWLIEVLGEKMEDDSRAQSIAISGENLFGRREDPDIVARDLFATISESLGDAQSVYELEAGLKRLRTLIQKPEVSQ